MWEEALAKIPQLKALDKQLQAFGAEHHGYRAGPRVPDSALSSIESRLGVRLPPQLASFYREVGDGGVGPHYGIVPSRALEVKDGKYVFVSEQGCGHRTYVMADGAGLDNVAFLDLDDENFVETTTSFTEFYENWLDAELAAFRMASALIDKGLSAAEISQELARTLRRHDGRDLVASIIDASKPEALFGRIGQKRYHGAVQFPWYESELLEFRARSAAAATSPSPLARTRPGAPWWQIWK